MEHMYGNLSSLSGISPPVVVGTIALWACFIFLRIFGNICLSVGGIVEPLL